VGGALLLPRIARATSETRGERRLAFVHTHTGERFTTTYWGDGAYQQRELDRVADFLRDFRTGERHPIDPALLDQLHDLAVATGARTPFQVVSGFRSPETNAALRASRGGQASHSLHMDGRAIDVRLADVSSVVLRDAALELARGGVGYYRDSDFVHVDTGRVRRW
jgi:uncharacterized protein YcbK (DUF882 family)